MGDRLYDHLEKRRAIALERVKQLDATLVIQHDHQEIMAALLEEYIPKALEIDFAKEQLLGMNEVEFDVSRNTNFLLQSGRGPKTAPGFRYEVAVPFTGDPELLSLRPSRELSHVKAEAFLRGDHLVLIVDTFSPDVGQVQQVLDQQRRFLQNYAAFVAEDISAFRTRLQSVLYEALAARRERLRQAITVQQQLGIPLYRNPDAPEPAPVVRKPLGLKELEERAQTEPGYYLEAEGYEQVIEVLANMGRALERTPKTFSKLEEPEMRDFMLVILNSTFEGASGGECFNGNGKTDILVRVQDRNIFVGECKLWHGESRFSETIEQLLGYTVWRDTKAAIILFITAKGVTAIIDKAEQVIREHPCFVKVGPPSEDRDQRRNFILHHKEDEERLVHLALLPFAIRRDA